MSSLHADARRVLVSWQPPDEHQAALRARYLTHLDRHEDALWRSCRPDHLTASTLVVSPGGDRVLLTLHSRIGRWLQLGGHCEQQDATLLSSALREAREESGIHGLYVEPQPVQLSFHAVPCGPVRPAHHLDVQFVAVAPEEATPVISAESADLRWFESSQLPALADAALRDLVRRGTAQISRASSTRRRS